ncbi:MAG: PaaI family thioesterase [Dehalococcoidales bacterium]|nr:PaaI family thioesterase [Dehalococcoidales bacterium]
MVQFPKVSINSDLSEGLCFGCGNNNPFGLKLHFKWDGQTARAEFIPGEHYQGWKGIIHGGILSCILDEAMTYAAHFQGLNCITARMYVTFKRPAVVDELLVITSSIIKNARRIIETRAAIFSRDGTLVAEATATQFVVEVEGPACHAGK